MKARRTVGLAEKRGNGRRSEARRDETNAARLHNANKGKFNPRAEGNYSEIAFSWHAIYVYPDEDGSTSVWFVPHACYAPHRAEKRGRKIPLRNSDYRKPFRPCFVPSLKVPCRAIGRKRDSNRCFEPPVRRERRFQLFPSDSIYRRSILFYIPWKFLCVIGDCENIVSERFTRFARNNRSTSYILYYISYMSEMKVQSGPFFNLDFSL